MPYVEFVLLYILQALLRIYDSGCYMCRKKGATQMKTKKKTHQQYINLYSGPDFNIQASYSSTVA